MRFLLTLSIPSLTLAGWGIARAGGPASLWWLGVVYALGVHPVLDLLLPRLKPTVPAVTPQVGSTLLLALSFPVQALVLATALLWSSTVEAGSGPFWALALGCGISAGAYGITAAHELIHRARPIERALGIGNLVLCLFAHFRGEHVFIHHRHVGTPADPATARRGESLYAFLGRSLAGGFLKTVRVEFQSPGRRKRLIRDGLLQLALIVAVASIWKEVGTALLLIQSLVAWVLLGTVNYLEHYGLERKPLKNGSFEAVGIGHSWESRHWLTNATLFNLGLHPQHHLQAAVSYDRLAPLAGSPQLPFGYSAALLVAFVPPLWKAIMNPRVDAVRTPQLQPTAAESPQVESSKLSA